MQNKTDFFILIKKLNRLNEKYLLENALFKFMISISLLETHIGQILFVRLQKKFLSKN